MRDSHLLRLGIGRTERRVSLAASSPFPFSLQRCSSDELDVLDRCRHPTTVSRLLKAGGDSPDRLRAVYALCASGILEDADGPTEATRTEPVVQMETGAFLLSQLQRRPQPTEDEVLRREVRQELERSAELNEEKWLQISHTAPRAVLIDAITAKMERYRSLLARAGDDPRLRGDVELILGRASALLRLARETEQTLQSGPSWKSAPVLVEGLPPRKPIAAGTTDTVAVTDDPKGTAHSRQGPDIGLLLKRAQAEMAVADYAAAVKTYAEVTRLAPGIPAYHVRHAIALACWPQTARQAELEFHEALSLDPNNPDIHYQFGTYYKAMKLRTRAVQEMRAAVSLNPHHEQARRELEALSPKDPALLDLRARVG